MSVNDLRSGQWVTFADGGRPASLHVRRCRIEVLAGPDAGKVHELESPVISVGARPGCEVPLNDPRVSGRHLEIRLDDRGYRLRDLESTNGTWVSGHRVNDIYINPGTVIAVGESRLRFEPLAQAVEVALSSVERFGRMVGRSAAMRGLFARLERIAAIDSTVLITGETGTGKELVASALHERSPRAGRPFVVLDCGAIPTNLVESELFGHERGAFTGATSSYAGAFERAQGGTVFLDEIGEMPADLQPKLLGVLERREFRRVGGARSIAVDIRVIAATNRDLAVEVNHGRFREDLYYRLAVAQVHVPPLRERREDIPLLVEHFLATLPGGARTALKPETIELMTRHDWPGNARELRNVVERAVLMAGSVSPALGRGGRPAPAGEPAADDERLDVAIDVDLPYKDSKQAVIEEFERRYVRKLLERHGGNVSAAARAAGLDRMSIHKILNRLGLANPRGRDQ